MAIHPANGSSTSNYSWLLGGDQKERGEKWQAEKGDKGEQGV